MRDSDVRPGSYNSWCLNKPKDWGAGHCLTSFLHV